MPDALDLPLTIPDELGSAAAVVAELRDCVVRARGRARESPYKVKFRGTDRPAAHGRHVMRPIFGLNLGEPTPSRLRPLR